MPLCLIITQTVRQTQILWLVSHLELRLLLKKRANHPKELFSKPSLKNDPNPTCLAAAFAESKEPVAAD